MDFTKKVYALLKKLKIQILAEQFSTVMWIQVHKISKFSKNLLIFKSQEKF